MNTLRRNIAKGIAILAAIITSGNSTAQIIYNPFRPQPEVIIVEEQPVEEPITHEFKYTLYTGLNLSELVFKKEKGIPDPDSKLRPAFDLGLRIDHYMYNTFTYYRSLGFRYSYGTYKVNFPGPHGEVWTTQNRFIVPFSIGVLGKVGDSYIGAGPNIHLGGAFGGTSHIDVEGAKDAYSASGDESSFVFGIGAEAWFTHRHIFYSISYNRSLEWYQMPEEFGDFKSNGRNMFSLNVGYNF